MEDSVSRPCPSADLFFISPCESG